MLRVLLIGLLFLAPAAVAVDPQPAEASGCFGLAPMCGLGLHPACICYDYFRNNCSWQCVR